MTEKPEINGIKGSAGKRQALCGWPMILGWVAMLIFACHASTHMVGAGDTWVAMACGRHFFNHGVDTVEPFSANSHRSGPTQEDIEKWPGTAGWLAQKVGLETVKYWHPTGWLNQNWLTHVIFYWLTHESPFADAESFSFNTVVYWKLAIYILAIICVYYIGRLLKVNPALSAFFACFAMFVGRSFFDIRPAGFSNLLVAVFLLVLILTTYRNILYIWLIVPLAIFWCNVHGGYIYLFIMLVPFTALNLLTSISKKRFTSIGLKGVYHTMGAGFVTLIAVIVFNPFHLTSLTHTFIISVSKHAEMWRTVNEWHPAFEWNNPVGDEIPFLIMYIIAWIVLLLWAAVLMATSSSVNRNTKRKAKKNDNDYEWPKIDLALLAIAALTIYMAIRSRRFIPVAGIVACPVLAMFIDQMVRAVSATRNFHRQNRLFVSPMSDSLQLVFTIAGVAVVLYFGIWWGLKFKRVYLDPWPTDGRLNSVFMRMTASDAKPFDACKFIRDNKMKGKIFNYWTEGGFIAWGQEPDPNTGKTPLKLFMDGRAQAAYEPDAYQLWQNIMAGGYITAQRMKEAQVRRRKLTAEDYKDIGEWLTKQLRKYDVWVVLMPMATYNDSKKPSYHTVMALERDSRWRLIFFNNKQKLFVDIEAPQTEKLFRGIDSGQTVYPNDFSRNLIIAHIRLLQGVVPEQGIEHAIKAFNEHPSQTPLGLIRTYYKRYPKLRVQITDFYQDYFDKFVENRDDWAKEHNFHHRVAAAMQAASFLQSKAKADKNAKLAEFYTETRQEYQEQRVKLIRDKRW